MASTTAAALAPDGHYAIVFTMGDACGGEGSAVADVEIDTTPPDVAVTEPAGGQRVSASVEVLGQVTDPHLAGWELDVACGGTADWTPVESGTRSIPAGTFVAFWDTSRAPPGECQLRLVAEDEAGNRSPEAIASVLVERGDLIERLVATPAVFSPNGDGRLDTAALELTLARSARVRLELRREGEVVRTLEAQSLLDAGPMTRTWDGLDDIGAPAPDGAYLLWMRAEDPAVATVYEEETVRVVIDTEPPVLEVTRPLPDGVEAPSSAVRGLGRGREPPGVRRDRVAGRRISPRAGPRSPVRCGTATSLPWATSRTGPTPCGSTRRILPRTPRSWRSPSSSTRFPRAPPSRRPRREPSFAGVTSPIAIVGLVGDDHLRDWTLRFGPGDEPVAFTPLAEGTEGGNEMPLAAWDVRHVPDGVYTLSLTATDRGGLSTESRVDPHPRRPGSPGRDRGAGGRRLRHRAVADPGLRDRRAPRLVDARGGPGGREHGLAVDGARSGHDVGASPRPWSEWSPLPEDGVYTLRLRAEDEVGLAATDSRDGDRRHDASRPAHRPRGAPLAG